jgi:hypothetical protein
MVIEFLHRVIETFKEYFDECSDTSIKDNYVIVFEVNNCFFFETNTILLFCSCWMKWLTMDFRWYVVIEIEYIWQLICVVS